jgi:hypothetical protein
MLTFIFNLLEEARRTLFDGTVGSLARWLGRVVRLLVVMFAGTGLISVGGGVVVIYLTNHALPTQTLWIVIAAVAVVLALLVTGAVGVWCVAHGVLYVLRHPFDHLTRRRGPSGGTPGTPAA